MCMLLMGEYAVNLHFLKHHVFSSCKQNMNHIFPEVTLCFVCVGVRSDISNKTEVCVVMWEAVSLFFFTHTIIYTVKPCLGNHCGIPVA